MSKFCHSIDNLRNRPVSAEYPEEVNLPLPPDASVHVLSVTDQGTVRLDLGGEKPVVLALNLQRLALGDSKQVQDHLGILGTAALHQSKVVLQASSADDFAHLQEYLLRQIWETVLIALEPELARIRVRELAAHGALLGRLKAMSPGAVTNVHVYGGVK